MRTNRHGVFFILALALLCGSSSTQAHILDAPYVMPFLPKVVQFGMPNDSAFVFCQSLECPERSMKHIAVSTSSVEWQSAQLLVKAQDKTHKGVANK